MTHLIGRRNGTTAQAEYYCSNWQEEIVRRKSFAAQQC
jgi:hypothetical protein